MKSNLRKIIFSTVALCASALASAQQAADPPSWSWYWPHMWSGGWGFWWVFPLLMCLFMVALCVGMFFMMSGGRGHSHAGLGRQPRGDPAFSALQVLNERFAKGEIQKREYEEKRATILGGPS